MIDENILVWIESTHGEIYNEYEYKDPKPARNECYIESKQSHNFRICWRFTGTTSHSLKAVIWLDGIEVGGGLLQSYQVHHTFRMSGRAIGDSKRLPFVFGKQQLTDDESSSSHLSNPEDLNTIWITFDHVTFIEYTTTPPSPPKHRGAIHEKVAKTAHGDAARLGGDPIHSPLTRWCKTRKVPGTTSVQFVFHYAPLQWLVARGVVSSSRSVTGKRKSPEKHRSPEKKRAIVVPPSTPQRHGHTIEELVVDSDSDSDVVVVVDATSSTKLSTRPRHSTPSKSKVQTTPVTPSKPRPKPRPKPNKSEDVIDLASSDDDFHIQ
ncbi:unnamed protein product [Rhizoctonia solani]|nr:unnamed protein product [Rhizoctonia solani]